MYKYRCNPEANIHRGVPSEFEKNEFKTFPRYGGRVGLSLRQGIENKKSGRKMYLQTGGFSESPHVRGLNRAGVKPLLMPDYSFKTDTHTKNT